MLFIEKLFLRLAWIPGLAPVSILFLILRMGITIPRFLGLLLSLLVPLSIQHLNFLLEMRIWGLPLTGALLAVGFIYPFFTYSIELYYRRALNAKLVLLAKGDPFASVSMNRKGHYVPGLEKQKIFFIHKGEGFRRCMDMSERVLRDLKFSDASVAMLRNSNMSKLEEVGEFPDRYRIEFELEENGIAFVMLWEKKSELPLTLSYSVSKAAPVPAPIPSAPEEPEYGPIPVFDHQANNRDEPFEVEEMQGDKQQDEPTEVPERHSDKRDYGQYTRKGY